MIVRDEKRTDRAAVRAVLRAAFGQSDEGDLVAQLRDDGDAIISLVAVGGTAAGGDEIVGHIMFSAMTAPFTALGLAPVAVVPARQGCGIGSGLIRVGLDRAKQQGWEGVFVVGAPAYYGRFGFTADLANGFTSPYAGAYFMARALHGALPARTGAVAYAPAFARLEVEG